MASSDQTATRAGGRHGRPWRAAGAAVVVLLAVAGAGMIGASLRTEPPPRPPQPIAQAAPAAPDGRTDPDVGAVTSDGQPEVDEAPAPAALPRSAPVTVSIPRIGVDAEVMSLGTNPDGTVQVPPLDQAQRAGWYAPGASPGEDGNAVIVGHVDSAKLGPAVFFELGSLHRGDTITVTRADGTKATFTVGAVRSYPKAEFPHELVFGPNERPALRVVTCGGVFDQTAGSYTDNVIVFATMTS
ncbi:class F sortase [Micromonospora halophytica]|uniref:Sortase family protein n=1 Tax=Micromonospora halophytica TaxID=47864 RepID=A0A1C5HEN8_9ACTN|nr:class F sortase [Micromonospora halophytica]SCG44465.1 Sortase family protein [Micromonospora halophytica]